MYSQTCLRGHPVLVILDRLDCILIATPIGAEGTSVSFNVNRVIHLDEYMKEFFSFVLLFSPTK